MTHNDYDNAVHRQFDKTGRGVVPEPMSGAVEIGGGDGSGRSAGSGAHRARHLITLLIGREGTLASLLLEL